MQFLHASQRVAGHHKTVCLPPPPTCDPLDKQTNSLALTLVLAGCQICLWARPPSQSSWSCCQLPAT